MRISRGDAVPALPGEPGVRVRTRPAADYGMGCGQV
eukprot:COSAG01_NODE_56889_length_315_cov_1.976852_1_plen_35_part_10